MFYLDIILAGIGTLLALVICVYNIIRKHRTPLNLVVSATALAFAGLCLFIVMRLVNGSVIPEGITGKAIIALQLLVATMIAFFAIIYPNLRVRQLAVAAAAGLAGFALAAVVMVADFASRGAANIAAAHPAVITVISLYLLAAAVIISARALMIENRAIRDDLVYLCTSMAFLFSLYLALSIYLPAVSGESRFATIGLIVPFSSMLVIISNAAVSIRDVDMKKFFSTAAYWIILSTILIAPSIAVVKYNTPAYFAEPVPSLGIALFLFAYLFLVFKYLSPRLENLFRREYRNLISLIDGLFSRQLSTAAKEKNIWGDFFNSLSEGIAETFGITGSYFYLYNRREKKFRLTHSYGNAISDSDIDVSSPVAALVSSYPGVLYRPIVYTSSEFIENRDAARDYFERNRIEVILPFLSPEQQVIGILSLGPLMGNRSYSKSMLSALDIYRLQFQQQLANAIMLEQVRATQVLEHDQMVVNTVKKKIIPATMSEAPGYRISSFYINNSPYGGDYFDSLRASDKSVLLFMSDSSYSGVESALLSLELYTVLHTPSKVMDAPDKILSTMNWVIATSRFTRKHASAYCALLASTGELTYSCASFNPMAIYNPRTDAFTVCETPGVPVGADKTSKYESKTTRLVPGSIGVIFSDGLVSAINQKGEAYSFDRAKEIIRAGRSKIPADIVRALYDDFKQFIQDKKQINDISLILFRYQ
ncbi:MAG: serine/threonine-protein phosphatase [Spirochaetes bacterium]|nr:serine/threonine-protein phosphatase [Spirochaetota bacterium]